MLAGGLLLAQTGLHAADFRAGSLLVSQPWAPAMPPVATVGAAYFTVTNQGKTDRLMSLSTPVARQVQLHESRTVQGVMEMRELDGLDCPPGVVKIEPGAVHVMLLGLVHPLAAGEQFPLSLHFRDAGVLTVQVAVRAPE